MSVAQRVALDRAKRAINAPKDEETGAQAAANDSGDPPPGALPPDIDPDPEQVEALRSEAGSRSGAKKAAPSARAGEALAALDFRVDQHGRLMYCHHTPQGRFEVWDAESSDAMDAIALTVRELTGSTPSREVLSRELQPVRALCKQLGKKVHVHNRVAPDGSRGYFLDIGNAAGEVVHVTAGGWHVEPNADIAFRRGGGYGELMVPATQLDTAPYAWNRIMEWLGPAGVEVAAQPILAVTICDWMRPDTPNAILELKGQSGRGKTTLACQCGAVIDPTTSDQLPSTKLSEPDVAAAASNRYVLGYDNAGGPLTAAEQDLCCKVSTGTTLATRRLYSQAEEFQVAVRAPLIITAVVPVITRADARTRTISVAIERRSEFIGALEVKAEFNAKRAQLTGALLTLLSAGLAGLESARATRGSQRLVDLEQLGEAITAAIGWEPGRFRAALRKHWRDAAEDQAAGSPIVAAVLKAFAELGGKARPGQSVPPVAQWPDKDWYAYSDPEGGLHVSITLKALLSRVNREPSAATYTSERYTNERAVSNALQVHAPTLEAVGITHDRRKERLGMVVDFHRSVQ
jgi:hypothetical protein